jgi:uncharacterized protein (TIRG00374 family)
MSQKFLSTLKKIARWLIPLLISGLAFWLILKDIDLSQFLTDIAKVGLMPLLLSSLLYFASFLFRVGCWYLLLRRKVSFKDTFFTMNAGYLLNNVFPFRLGEIGRALLLADPEGPSALEAFSSVIVERVFDVFLSAVFVLTMLSRILTEDYNQTLVFVIFGLALLGMIALYLTAKFRMTIMDWLTRWGERNSFVHNWVRPKAAQLLEGFSVLEDPRMFFLAFGSLFISWLLAFAQNYVIFEALYPNPPFWWMVFVLSVGAFGIALPSAPAGLGVFEGAMVAAFALLGVGREIAFAHAIIIHAMSFFYNNILGLIGLRLRGEALVGLYQRAVRRSPDVKSEI